MPTATVNAALFVQRSLARLSQVAGASMDRVGEAARLVADCIAADGVVHAFGTGHSQAAVMELAGRAGGFIPTNRIGLGDIVLYGGEPPEALANLLLEREPGLAPRLYALAAPRPGDVFVIISNSGVNNVVVEMALRVREAGHRLIAVTSVEHTTAVPARHPSGQRLADLADVVLDNGAPAGDALLDLPGGTAVGALSSLTAALLIQMVVTEATGLLLAAGHTPPVYRSSNVPGGYEYN
ncbi:MAG TPA: SIS domain-containing protein, partial [Rugosimonospora sp.]|nr:SIS domain-containing protein [Rugosimonospora sp.]